MFAKGRITTTGDVFRDEKSLAFDGTNDYVDTSFVASNEGITNDVTVSCWFKAADLAASSNAFVWNFYQSTSDGFGIKFSSSTFKVIADIDNADSNLYTTTLDINKWYLAVVVIDSLEVKLYINGVLEGSGTSVADGLDSFTSNFYIANRKGAAGTGEFNGNISEVAIYNSALTINQVKTIYNGREPYNHKEGVASGNLKAWYRMGDGSLDEYALIGDETNITLGNNLITNGTFDADSDWVKSGSGATISSGQATLDLDADTFIYQDVGTVGKVYKMTFDLVVTSGEVKLGTNADFQYTYSAGTYTNESVYLIATTTNRFIFRRATGDLEATIDNVSVQQVGDNAGIMNNMSATDIEGDTP
mgnify:CR=1 FL=1|tara:strand:- start:1243 stop:2325 length:1083 start_codon:yes stop_codon:yes gene_type:complete